MLIVLVIFVGGLGNEIKSRARVLLRQAERRRRCHGVRAHLRVLVSVQPAEVGRQIGGGRRCLTARASWRMSRLGTVGAIRSGRRQDGSRRAHKIQAGGTTVARMQW